jgi:hypothetical protein
VRHTTEVTSAADTDNGTDTDTDIDIDIDTNIDTDIDTDTDADADVDRDADRDRDTAIACLHRQCERRHSAASAPCHTCPPFARPWKSTVQRMHA